MPVGAIGAVPGIGTAASAAGTTAGSIGAGSGLPGVAAQGGSIISDLFNIFGMSNANKYAQNFAKGQQNQQFLNNLMSWGIQTKYNSPKNQIARLRAAGVNPALLYKGAPQNTSSPVAATQQAKWNPQNIFSGVGNIGMNAIQTNQMRMNTALQSSQIAKTAAETAKISQDKRHAQGLYQTSLDTANQALNGLIMDNTLKSYNMTAIEDNLPDYINTVKAKNKLTRDEAAIKAIDKEIYDNYGIRPGDGGYATLVVRALIQMVGEKKAKSILNRM